MNIASISLDVPKSAAEFMFLFFDSKVSRTFLVLLKYAEALRNNK
jgi:hypothetical protein